MTWTDTTGVHVRINHDILIKKLSAMGVRALVRGIAACLLDCEHRVKTDDPSLRLIWVLAKELCQDEFTFLFILLIRKHIVQYLNMLTTALYLRYAIGVCQLSP